MFSAVCRVQAKVPGMQSGKAEIVLHSANGYIRKELRSTDLLIGHAYFIGKSADDLGSIMNNSIIPLLYEYFYDDEAKVKKALDCLADTDFVIDTAYRGRIRITKKG